MMDEFDHIAQYPIYFAPGCQLLQLQPGMVSDVYDYLRHLFGNNIHLYTRCCGLDDANQHNEEAVFITLCDACFRIYGLTYANLHMRDFWEVYDEYKDIYPLGDKEQELRAALKSTLCDNVFPQAKLKDWLDEWKSWSTSNKDFKDEAAFK